MSLFTRLLLERCARAGAAAMTAAISMQIVTGDLNLNAIRTIAIGAGAAFVSAFLSVLSQAIGDPASTSFTRAVVDGPESNGK